MTEKEWRHNRVVVLITVVLVFGGFTMVVAFVPFYLQELGITNVALNATYSGALISISPLLAALLGPTWGRLADRRGLKPMALRAMLAFTISWIIFGMATHVYHLVIARILGGIFGGFNALSIPLATLGCPPEKQGRTIGAVQSTRTASIALGPLAGGFLADWVGIRNTAFIASSLYLLAFVVILLYYRESPQESRREDAAPPLRIADMLTRWELLPLSVTLFLASFMDRGFGPVIPLMVLELGAAPSQAAPIAGAVISGAALASTLSAWWVGRLSSKRHPVRLLRIMTVGSTLVSIPLAFCSSNMELAVYRFLLGLMAGGIFTVAYLLGNVWIPSGSQATGMGMLTSAVLLGNALGPLCVGFLASLGLRVALGVSVFVFAALAWVAWRQISPKAPFATDLSAAVKAGPTTTRLGM